MAILYLFVVLFACANAIDLEVTTNYGKVLGKIDGAQTVWSIPYAAPPTGQNRWRSPQPLSNWSDTYDATKQPPVCPQVLAGFQAQLVTQNEDCLYLTINVPVNHTLNDTQLPVQVFIHGGAFTSAGAPLFTGSILGGDDVIYIGINYRLGALGLLAIPALQNSADHKSGVGFYAIQDQRAALQWIHDNIQYFGGNSSRVTLSGESSGATSTCVHMATPKSAGLFQQAIIESLGLCNIFDVATSLSTSQAIVAAIGCNSTVESEVIACLQNVNTTALVNAPSLTNPTLIAEITEQPVTIFKKGGGMRVPLLIGSNLNESSLYVCTVPELNNMTSAQYEATVTAQYPNNAAQVLQLYPTSDYPTPTAAYIALTTDDGIRCSAVQLADIFGDSSSVSPVYMYEFNHVPSFFEIPDIVGAVWGVDKPACLGVAHSYELPILFPVFETVLNSMYGLSLTAEEHAFRQTMRNAWAAFVKTGSPVLPSIEWPLYNHTTANFVNLDLTFSTGSNYRSKFCDFWNNLPAHTTTTTAASSTTAAAATTAATVTSTSGSLSTTAATATASTGTATAAVSTTSLAVSLRVTSFVIVVAMVAMMLL